MPKTYWSIFQTNCRIQLYVLHNLQVIRPTSKLKLLKLVQCNSFTIYVTNERKRYSSFSFVKQQPTLKILRWLATELHPFHTDFPEFFFYSLTHHKCPKFTTFFRDVVIVVISFLCPFRFPPSPLTSDLPVAATFPSTFHSQFISLLLLPPLPAHYDCSNLSSLLLFSPDRISC